MEPKELSPALLQPQVTVVAIVGELLATLPSLDEMNLLVSALRLYWDLDEFTWEFRVTLYCITDTSGCHNVTSDDDDDDSTTYLSQGLAKYRNTPWTSPYDLRKADDLIKAASIWQMGLFLLVDLWAKLARKATKLHHTCRVVANKVTDMASTATARARELQAEASCDGTAQENMVELGQALGGEEGAEVVAGTEAQVRRYAVEAASEARRVRQRLEVALGLLERLVAACDEATAFPRELQRLLRGTEAAVKRTNEASPNVPLCEEAWWPRWLWPSGCGRPTPAWSRITCWGHFKTSSSSISLVVPPAPVPVGWPSGAKEPWRTSQGSFDTQSVIKVSPRCPQ
ncbi:uncharacterized protein LOC115484313 [Serinus canaria]|uniref:uncharacterized protein LOC115484313 n=1 Tax=Serinus canaria TaxID=9135 RepID=UPI0021CCEF54|nr:uncharacterized protein LOC115484313 [Serinus canaria]